MDDEEIMTADLLTWDGDSRGLDAEAVAEAFNRLLARIRVLERESGHRNPCAAFTVVGTEDDERWHC